MSTVVADEYCPKCGSLLDEGACVLCVLEQPGGPTDDGESASRPRCRSCGNPVEKRTSPCEICGAENPGFVMGMAPVAQFVLGLFLLAVALLVASLIFGPLVS